LIPCGNRYARPSLAEWADPAQILAKQDDLLANASLLDEMDLTLGFAQAADELRWVRPTMQDSYVALSLSPDFVKLIEMPLLGLCWRL
jgi:hypothetical protein